MHNPNFLLFKLHPGNKNQDIQISNILKSNCFMSNLTFIQFKRYIVANYTSNTGSATNRAGSDTFLEHMGSTPIFAGVRIVILLMPCCWVFFVDHCLSFCPFFQFAIVLYVLRFTTSLNTPLVPSNCFPMFFCQKLIDMISFPAYLTKLE